MKVKIKERMNIKWNKKSLDREHEENIKYQ